MYHRLLFSGEDLTNSRKIHQRATKIPNVFSMTHLARDNWKHCGIPPNYIAFFLGTGASTNPSMGEISSPTRKTVLFQMGILESSSELGNWTNVGWKLFRIPPYSKRCCHLQNHWPTSNNIKLYLATNCQNYHTKKSFIVVIVKSAILWTVNTYVISIDCSYTMR